MPARLAAAPAPPTLEPPSARSAEAHPKETLDRGTPRRTMDGFLREAKDGDFRTAASYLDLRSIPLEARDAEGPELARKLAYVLERTTFDPSRLSDEPEGDGSDDYFAVRLYAGEEPVPVILDRERFPDGLERWLIGERTVVRIPRINAAAGPNSIVESLPQPLRRPTFLGNELWQWLGLILGVFVAYLIGRATAAVLVRAARLVTRRMPTRVFDALVKSARRPLRLIIAALTYRVLLNPLALTASVRNVCDHIAYSALVIGMSLGGAARARASRRSFLEEREAREGYDPFTDRRIRTRTVLLRRLAGVFVGCVAFSFLVVQFEFVRSVGDLAPRLGGRLQPGRRPGRAEVAGHGIIGGIQFSIAQPVRVHDQVVVEGEFGDIEEIHLTYVVVRVWDKRRLVAAHHVLPGEALPELDAFRAMDLVGAVVAARRPVDPRRRRARGAAPHLRGRPAVGQANMPVQVTDADQSTSSPCGRSSRRRTPAPLGPPVPRARVPRGVRARVRRQGRPRAPGGDMIPPPLL